MIEATESGVRAILNMDPTMTDAERAAFLKAGKQAVTGKVAAFCEREPIDRPLKTAEVAKLMGKHPETIRLYCCRGVLRRIQPKGFTRPIGISEQSVRDFMAGRSQRKGRTKAA